MKLPVLLLTTLTAFAQDGASFDFRKVVTALAARAEANQEQFTMEGSFSLIGQRGNNPARELSKTRFKYAVAPEGRSYLRLQPEGKIEYLLISNGQRTWAYVPKLKQYSQEESARIVSRGDDGDEESTNERDFAERFLPTVLPHLATFHQNADAADVNGTAPVNYESRRESWPVIRVMSKRDAQGARSLTELVIDPTTLAIGRFILSHALQRNGERNALKFTLDFTRFTIGEPEPASTFEFVPPNNAKRVDAVPIPGQTGSILLQRPAPDFELKTLDGQRVRLSDLRGKPVLLSFWASWCGPCRKELPGLADLHDIYGKKGLQIYGINDEGRSTARDYAEKAALSFPTLDDSSRKAHGLYRVESIPTIFLIDAEGKIVRFLRGSQSKEDIQTALKSVGF